MEYKPTIGLEIHAELKTKSKMFCDCKNDPDEKRPNMNVCPVCLGHPGVLPTINRNAVEAVIKLGLALGGKISKHSKFDRKNYFYPDLPKGYQISQYDEPLVQGGKLNGVRLTRIHLEEDTGRLQHGSGENSLVDFNRSSIPLMELVTEPDIKSADEALAFAKELQLILRYLGISDADMEKAQMRIEANISVSKTEKLGTKVELKNINSFSAVKNAVAYEIKRQIEVLESGGKVAQETRGWNDVKGETFSQRSKEEAHDYRYMPEPDLPPLEVSADVIERLKIEIPELPWAKRERFMKEYSLTIDQANILVSDRWVAEFFEEAVSEAEYATPQLIYNYLTSDLLGMANAEGISVKESKVEPVDFVHLIDLIHKGTLNSRSAKNVLSKMWTTGVDPHQLVKQEGLTQVTDESALAEVVAKVVECNPKAVEDYKKGNTNSLQFLIGKAMAELRGRGNPELLSKLFEESLTK
ncbi:glutaminyl-tRNA synthase (glutamine-hydrolyzing) subunit B [Candidatus Nomurabacteria bacterium RIFCSPLOWO2_02_FULL_40_10]|uniref:Aspartyl/glutamyl-tRNA(Asn/Gln) amidotransferase subunit B n=1 Tax=Candidatus Nomurabacteria bacterium RIFCSPLOWO2_02_FULL_40_10 TaxID=1801786 RepID=A0A1F6XW02_9BACT|nr:MAG: glutaminyl-tRNA synthase (glutamine-hydrolyzing) subunit B [Candidatus Nomurabacteria bacterium RIFCSPLOWO2_02_FULL_40_10]